MNTTTPSLRPASYLRAAAGLAAALIGITTYAANPAPIIRDEHVVVRTPAREIKRADRDFFTKAARAGMDEVEISRVAAQRTTNPDVRKLAQMIVEDHTAANEELATLAANCGVALPARESRTEDKWLKHDARSFDKDYLDEMVDAHQDAVKQFEREARNGDDPEAVAFARKHLAAMQHHLQQALDLKRILK
jgi:putative membrane protein